MSDPVRNVRMWGSMMGGKEIPLDKMYEMDFKKLKADEVEIRDSLQQDLVCLYCQRIHQNKIWVIRCANCDKLDYPRLTLVFACLDCGGEQELLKRYRMHQKEHTSAKL